MNTCHYCGKEGDVRPYGPGGSWVCFPCGTSPEHEPATEAAFNTLLDAAAAVSPSGVVLIMNDGPEPFVPDRSFNPDFGEAG